MPKYEEEPKIPDDQVFFYRDPCIKFNNKRMTIFCVLILPFLLLILLPAWAIAGSVEGSVQGLSMVKYGKTKVDDVFVILTAGKQYYFLPNVDSAFLSKYQNCRVRVTGNVHPVYPSVVAKKIELFWGGEWKSIWPFMAEISNGDFYTVAVVVDNIDFGFDLYQKLKDEEGNLCFSPYSISSDLAMVYAGTLGQTEKEMAEVLHFSLIQNELHSAFSKLQSHLNIVQPIKIIIANSLWAKEGYDSWNLMIRQYYISGLKFVDFEKQIEATREKINFWGLNKTQQKIKELIKPSMINSLSRLVLCNAVYFKGNWLNKFNKTNTSRNVDFHISHDKTIKAPMMSQKSKFKIKDFGDFSAIELPYENASSMVVFLPKKLDGLADFETKLTNDSVKNWIYELTKSDELEVLVNLPKFESFFEFELSKILSDMGMSRAFTLSGKLFLMGTYTDIYLNKVIHQSFVDNNEEGTAAAAATALTIIQSAVQSPLSLKKYPTFKADHPFVFLIREYQTGSILFIGRVVDPTK